MCLSAGASTETRLCCACCAAVSCTTMPNALTRHVGLNVGTWVVETLVKHYFEQLRREKVDASTVASNGELRHDELFYDEAFHIVKVCRFGFSRNLRC